MEAGFISALANIQTVQFDDENHRVLVTSGSSTNVFESSDNGRTWSAISTGWRMRNLHLAHGRLVGTTAFDGVVIQPEITARRKCFRKRHPLSVSQPRNSYSAGGKKYTVLRIINPSKPKKIKPFFGTCRALYLWWQCPPHCRGMRMTKKFYDFF